MRVSFRFKDAIFLQSHFLPEFDSFLFLGFIGVYLQILDFSGAGDLGVISKSDLSSAPSAAR